MGTNQGSKSRFIKTTGVVIFIILVVTGLLGLYTWNRVDRLEKQTYEPLPTVPNVHPVAVQQNTPPSIRKSDPISILLLGVDERQGDHGRSDTMVVLTVNPEKGTTEMFSIPRDTRTTIIGRDAEDKINHAYAFGGTGMSVGTVDHLLGIPVNYYVKVNMEGFKEMIDALGGVELQNSLAFSVEGHDYPAGTVTLTGDDALRYVRMRHDDPEGDFGRQKRQQAVIKAIVGKAASIGSLPKFEAILESLGSNVKTNIQIKKDGYRLYDNYNQALKNVETLHIDGRGRMIDNIYYYIPNEQSLNEIRSKFKAHLELS